METTRSGMSRRDQASHPARRLKVCAIDVAPTVAYLLNIPGPTSARGKILYDALANGAALREVTILDISDFHGQLIPLPANTDSL